MKTVLTIEGTPKELAKILSLLAGKAATDTDETEETDEFGTDTDETADEPEENSEPTEEEQFEAICEVVAKKSQANKKEKIRALLTKFKIKKLPELQPAKYATFKAQLDKL